MIHRSVYIVVFLSICVPLAAQVEFRYRRLTQEEGLSHNGVSSIAQDRDGFMWIGTPDGLNRFDGYSFKVFRHDPKDPHSISANEITDIYVDRRGMVWIATSRKGVNRYEPSSESFVRYPESLQKTGSLSGNDIAVMMEDRALNFWIGTKRKGINRYDRQHDRFIHYNSMQGGERHIPRDTITGGRIDGVGDALFGTDTGDLRYDRHERRFIAYSDRGQGHIGLYRDTEGTYWRRTRTVGFERYDSQWRFLKSYPAFPRMPGWRPEWTADEDAYVTQQFTQLGGVLTYVTLNGLLARYDIRTDRFSFFSPWLQFENFGKVFQTFSDSRGVLWFAASSGLYQFDETRGRFHRFISDPLNPNSLTGSTIIRLFEDRSGVLWVGSFEGGLTMCERVERKFFPVRGIPGSVNGLVGNNVRSLLPAGSGRIWVGALGGLSLFDPVTGRSENFRYRENDPTGLGGAYVGSIALSGNSTLWVGTWDGTLSEYNIATGTWNQHTYQPLGRRRINPYGVRQLCEDQDGMLWIGTRNNLLIRYDRNTRTSDAIRVNPGGPDDSEVFVLRRARDGTFLVGTAHGLFAFNPATRQFKRDPADTTRHLCLLDLDIRSVYEDPSGTLWVGTNGTGLFKRAVGTRGWQVFGEEHGLPNNTVYAILPDQNRELWFGTNKGLCRFNPRTQDIRSYTESDGLQSNEFNTQAACRLPDGRLCFGGVNGLNLFAPDSVRDLAFRPPVVISSFRVFDVARLPQNGVVELAYNQNYFSIEFAALSYFHQQKNRYAYRLEGIDPGWVHCGNRRYVAYSNVAPGDYVFRVKASNCDGRWNEQGVTLRIRIDPPWWRTSTAYVLFAVFIVAGIFGFDRIQRMRVLRNVRADSQVREAHLRAQTAEAQARALEAENERHESDLAKARELGVAYRALEESMHKLKDTQQQLIQQEKLASLGQLTAGIAHEIKNPLNFVNNFSSLSIELLEELRAADSNEEREAILGDLTRNLSKIEEHGKRADSIVHSMMMHARSGSGEREETDVNQLLQETAMLTYHSMKAAYRDCAVSLDFQLAPDLPRLKVVRQEIGRVFLNIIQNGMQAMQADTRKDSSRMPHMTVSTTRAENGIEIRIRDNGPGIPAEIRDRIFQPFFTTKPAGEGTGLGLSMSHDIIVKGHGGGLAVHDVDGGGAEFVIRLPA